MLKSSLNCWLRNLHHCSVEIVCDVTYWCFAVFLHSSQNVSVINCCCLAWSTCSVSISQFSSGFSGHSKLLYKLSPLLVQWLWSILLFFQFQNGLVFSQRQLSSLHVSLSFLTQMQSSQVKSKVKTKTRHSELFICPINLTGHILATTNICQSHVPILLLT